MSNYLDNYAKAQNELMWASVSNDYKISEAGEALQTILESAKQNPSDRSLLIAELCLARCDSDLNPKGRATVLMALLEAYETGVIDGKRSERAKKRTA